VMGYLVYLQDEGVLCGDYGIYGVGSVPESYATKVFSSLRAKPFGSTSFFVFHQDLHPYIPMAKLETKYLPHGFTYYVNGHVHSPRLEKNVLVVGSTVITQMKEDESEKSVWMWDRGFEKLSIESRPMYRVEVNAGERAPSEVLSEVNDALGAILKKEHAEDPMIRVKVTGKLASGFKPSDLIFTNDFGAIISFDKKLEGSAIEAIGLEHFDLDELAVGSMKRVLEEKGLNLDPVRLYGLLMRGDEAAVWKMLEELK
jgi:DNA repair exonuclease SbcCD nuclease subunit